MLSRLSSVSMGPISDNSQCQTNFVATKKINIEQELKLGVEYICQLQEKLSQLSYNAQVIIRNWLTDTKQY